MSTHPARVSEGSPDPLYESDSQAPASHLKIDISFGLTREVCEIQKHLLAQMTRRNSQSISRPRPARRISIILYREMADIIRGGDLDMGVDVSRGNGRKSAI